MLRKRNLACVGPLSERYAVQESGYKYIFTISFQIFSFRFVFIFIKLTFLLINIAYIYIYIQIQTNCGRKKRREKKVLRQTAKKAILGLGNSRASPSIGLGRRLYHENVIEHFDNPRNVGSFNRDDPNVGTGYVGTPACGDVMKLQIKVNESGQITETRFKTFGCGSAIAASSVASEWIKGKTIPEVLTIKNAEIAKHLRLSPVKLHCSMLAEDAIKSAVKNYKEKQANANAAAAGETTVP